MNTLRALGTRYYERAMLRFEAFFATGEGHVRDGDIHTYSMNCNNLAIPDGHPKLLHCWPVKLLQAGRGDYAGSEVMIRRAAASLSL